MTRPESPESLMQAAHEVARVAGAFALRHFRAGVTVEWKGDGSPVTVADRGAEAVARAWIQARFPDDAILGEEMGEKSGTSGRKWLVDPIDGTKSFVRGVPLWGSLVAVMDGDDVLAGAACYAAAGESLAAAPGCGCWHDGARARVSDVARLGDATVLITDDRELPGWETFARNAAVSRTWGDCFGYLLVATGRAEVMVDAVLNPWDSACLLPIIQEAGGVFTDLKGTVTAIGANAIATNANIAREARRILCST
jgi:histidinol phosphatase-like enzyme (inositol monophosphatase family)